MKYKLVSVEPSHEILQAMASSCSSDEEGGTPLADLIGFSGLNRLWLTLDAAYKAAIAAAPTPVMPELPEAATKVYADDDGEFVNPTSVIKSGDLLYTAGQVRQFAAAQNAELIAERDQLRTAIQAWEDATAAFADFEREHPDDSTKRWDAKLAAVSKAEEGMRASIKASSHE